MTSRLLPFDTTTRCACGHRACAEIDGEALCAACVRRLEMERAGNENTEREITLLLCRAEPVSERFKKRPMHRDGAEKAGTQWHP